jgi:peroxiredoxin
MPLKLILKAVTHHTICLQLISRVIHRATSELKASGQAERAKKVCNKAPSFTLKDSEGKTFSSKDLLAKGPLVVNFYRGVWCPYCNMELQALDLF